MVLRVPSPTKVGRPRLEEEIHREKEHPKGMNVFPVRDDVSVRPFTGVTDDLLH